MSGSPTTSQTYYDVYGNPASMLGDVYFNDAGIPMSGENRLYTSPTQGMELALNPSNSGWSSPYTADQYNSLGYKSLTPDVWGYSMNSRNPFYTQSHPTSVDNNAIYYDPQTGKTYGFNSGGSLVDLHSPNSYNGDSNVSGYTFDQAISDMSKYYGIDPYLMSNAYDQLAQDVISGTPMYDPTGTINWSAYDSDVGGSTRGSLTLPQSAKDILLLQEYNKLHPDKPLNTSWWNSTDAQNANTSWNQLASQAFAEQQTHGSNGGLFDSLGPILGIAGLAMGIPAGLDFLSGLGAADAGVNGLMAADIAMNPAAYGALGAGAAGAVGASTIPSDVLMNGFANTALTDSGLANSAALGDAAWTGGAAGVDAAGTGGLSGLGTAGEVTAASLGLTGADYAAANAIADTLGSGSLGLDAAAAGTGGLMSGIGDTLGNIGSSIGNLFSGSSPSDYSSLLNSDGSLNYANLAAQDYADFGASGVNALGNSLGSTLTDYTNPILSQSAIDGMINSGTLSNLASQLGINPTSLLKSIISGNGSTTTGQSGSLWPALLGGLLGSTSGSKQSGTTTTTQVPWASQQPYLSDLFSQAQAASANGSTPNSYQNSAANALNSVTNNGPTYNPYLGVNNPYLTQAIANANSDITKAIQPTWDAMSRQNGDFGNSGINETMAKQLADTMQRTDTSMRMQDYTNQQNLYQQAVQNTAGNANSLLSAGSYLQQMPWQNILNYGKAVGGASYGNSTTTPYYTNPGAGAIGGAIAGSQIAKNLGL